MDVITYALCKGNGGGSGGGVLVVNGTWSDDGCTLDKTWQEINDGGFGVVAMTDEHVITYCPIVNVVEGIEGVGYYTVNVIFYGDSLDIMNFTASSASGYPVWPNNAQHRDCG